MRDVSVIKSGIYDNEDAYNNSDGDVLLDNEDDQLDPSSYPQDERIYPMKSIKVERGFYTAYELKRKYDKIPSLVVLDSDFRRESVWKLQQKRELNLQMNSMKNSLLIWLNFMGMKM